MLTMVVYLLEQMFNKWYVYNRPTLQSANANTFVDFTGLANIDAVANLINNTAEVNANITANTTLITTVDGSGNLVEN